MTECVPHFDTRTLAVGVVYLLTNKATLQFPGSNRAAPSLKVVVDTATRGLFRPSDRSHFPFWVYWGVWHDAIVPVLETEEVQVIVRTNPSLRVHINQVLISLEVYDELIRKVEKYIIDSLVRTGYLPGHCSPLVAEELNPPPDPLEDCPPEPTAVNYNPTGPVGPDVDTLYHPDGTPKKSYKRVD